MPLTPFEFEDFSQASIFISELKKMTFDYFLDFKKLHTFSSTG